MTKGPLFCKKDLQKRLYSAKETYDLRSLLIVAGVYTPNDTEPLRWLMKILCRWRIICTWNLHLHAFCRGFVDFDIKFHLHSISFADEILFYIQYHLHMKSHLHSISFADEISFRIQFHLQMKFHLHSISLQIKFHSHAISFADQILFRIQFRWQMKFHLHPISFAEINFIFICTHLQEQLCGMFCGLCIFIPCLCGVYIYIPYFTGNNHPWMSCGCCFVGCVSIFHFLLAVATCGMLCGVCIYIPCTACIYIVMLHTYW